MAICGSSSKMGQFVIKVANELGHWIADKTNSVTMEYNFSSPMPDIYIDFSIPAGAVKLCEVAAKFKIPAIIGTTGVNGEDMRKWRIVRKLSLF
jgi:dihydrodipicolinate reductase